jgi:hypothetical protein
MFWVGVDRTGRTGWTSPTESSGVSVGGGGDAGAVELEGGSCEGGLDYLGLAGAVGIDGGGGPLGEVGGFLEQVGGQGVTVEGDRDAG